MPASAIAAHIRSPARTPPARAGGRNGPWCQARRLGAGRDPLTGGAARRGMRLAAVLPSPGTCTGKQGPHRGLAGSLASARPGPARQCPATARTFRRRLSAMPPPSATTVIILYSGHGARIVWLKPMSEGLPRGLPATLIAANRCPAGLTGPQNRPSQRQLPMGRLETQLVAARERQASPAWKAGYQATRPKVERKIGHLMRRRHGGRRARVRGQAKAAADFTLLAAAVNLARLGRLGLACHSGTWVLTSG